MSRIFVTGDTHGTNDISKLNIKNFPEQRELTKDDYIIIAGDYGQVWAENEGDYPRKELNDRSFTTLFVDGNHENFDLLESYPVEKWKGGKVHFIEDSIIHLMRGQVYTIAGKRFFTMGGATSIDKAYRTEGVSWWAQEQPSVEEYVEAVRNLERYNWEVDYVITHTTSPKTMNFMEYPKEHTALNDFLGFLQYKLKHKEWYFGHFHEEWNDGKNFCLYNTVKELEV